mmetsp:Transcript_45689/g.133024  ORF Transcript_45689/g.133024 Transcript_45689/m.133024 type:complete len:213 (-) Transcript_45689:884-1522(-)
MLGRPGEQLRGVSELRRDVEMGLSVERQHLEHIHLRALGEDHCRLVLSVTSGHCGIEVLVALPCLRIRGAAHPTDEHRVRGSVLDFEVPHFVQRRQDRRLERAAAGDGLLLVHGGGNRLAAEGLGADLLDPRDTGASADDLDRVDLVDRDAGCGLRVLQHPPDSLHGRGTHRLQVGPRYSAGEVLVLHQALACDGSLRVRGQDLFCLQHRVL